jgi:hypothetical protein
VVAKRKLVVLKTASQHIPKFFRLVNQFFVDSALRARTIEDGLGETKKLGVGIALNNERGEFPAGSPDDPGIQRLGKGLYKHLVHARPHEMMTTTLASPLPNGSRFCCGAAHEGRGCTRS